MAERKSRGRGAKRVVDVLMEQPPIVMEDVRNLSSAAGAAIIPTPEQSLRQVVERIEEVFYAVGTDKLPGTVIPAGRQNNSSEASEFVVADKLKKLAEERLKKAVEAAEKAGVFGNKEDYKIGDTVFVFSDPNFAISVKMGKPSQMIDRGQVEAAASEFLGRKSSEFLERCFKPRAATKQIIVSMK